MSCKIRWKHKKNIFKFLSILLVAAIIIGFQIGINLKTQAAEELTEPSFSVSDLIYIPKNPKVGEDITVTGTIRPNDFVTSVPENDIVLVLDVSRSMDKEIQVQCMNNAIDKECTETRGDYCIDCDEYVDANHREDKPYANHRVNLEYYYWNGYRYYYYYYCYDCGSYINYDQETHRNEQPYINHNVIHDYCSKHNEVGSDSSYCPEHNKVGEHTYTSTKLKELKKAANNFIDKMKNVPNVKIGIVAYSTEAWINPVEFTGNESVANYKSINEKNYSLINSSNDSELKDIVNCLKAVGGTNTGEGMRKGLGLLEKGSKDARKTVILMSDGEPTYYSSYSFDGYYTELEGNPNYIRGTGNSDYYSDCINYATTIGKIVRNKGYNAFTIGYGLDKSGNEKMEKIQNSMTGKDLTNDEKSNEENGFFATSNGAIDGVFNAIGNKILDEYSVDNGFFYDKMVDGFELAIGSDKVAIPSMKYKRVGEITNGKITYHCDRYEFSIVIKGRKSGEFENIFDKSYISFLWGNKTISTPMADMGISIDDNKLPNIKAELISEQNVRLDPNTSSSVTYKINAENFQYKDTTNQTFKKDVVILVDTSSGMDVQKLNQFKNGVFDKLLSDDTLRAINTKYSVITYDSVATIKNPDNEENHNNYKDVAGDTENLKQNPNRINDLVINKLTTSQTSDRNIGDALEKAADVFDEDKGQCDRYLLLVSSGKVEYTQQNIEDFKKKVGNFKVLSLAVGSNNDNNIPEAFLYNLHKDLAEEKSAQLASDNNEGNYFVSSGKKDNNDINNTIMSQIAEKIKSNGQKRDYEFNISLKFNLGNDIDLVSGLTPIGENYYTVNTKVVYKYNSTTNKYEAEPVNDVTFEVKPNKIGQKCKFGSGNTISYQGITDFIERNIGKTPEFIIESENIQHGIYQGREYSGSYNLDESNSRTYYRGSMATMGIKAEVYGNDPLTLTIGDNATIEDKIKVYNVETGQLIDTIDTSSDSRNYSIPIIGIASEDKKNIFILYTVKINDNASGKLTNKITTYTETYKDAEINIGGELPDLF